ncbi:MAG: hypothetical protein JWO63_2158 [Frankiales bacterium]|nr:hypothetical protein [Frankiales bacterium]
MTEQAADRAEAAIQATGLRYRRVEHGAAGSIGEAAALLGLGVSDILKTLVVRRGEADYVFVLVPGDRAISWPKLRALLGVNRLSMPPAAVAKDVTGYERGTITPFGADTAWPVIADERVAGRAVSIGGGARGVAFILDGDDLISVLNGQRADVTDPAEPVGPG